MLIEADELVDMGPVADKPAVRLAKYKNRYFRVDQDVLAAAKDRLAGGVNCDQTYLPRLTSGVDSFLALLEDPVAPKRQVRAIADVDASWIARPLALLIAPLTERPSWFWLTFITVSFANLAIFTTLGDVRVVGSHWQHWLLIPIGLALIAVVHELGHLASAMALGCKAHNIGVGFYRVLPVFFADVSDIWRLRPGDRAMVDAAGIHMQLIVGLVIFAAYGASAGEVAIYLQSLFFANLFVVMLNLLPFGRLDGYWIVSDLLNVTNLQKDSRAELRNTFSNAIRADRSANSRSNLLLSFYAAVNMCFIGFIICVFIFGLLKISISVFRSGLNWHSVSLLATHPLSIVFVIALVIRILKWSAGRHIKT